ncbi:hypothetical protein ACFSCZ_04765 [Siminovitchia sediminis]|uniref:Uncharacterized protein n=1 Tax=Siminovitchia sediminis TaxID=1274353 RepID=A0ABW4KCY7_9BACI
MLVSFYLMEEQHLSKEEAWENMTLGEYRQKAIEIFETWDEMPLASNQKQTAADTLDVKFQRIWSDRLPRGTAQDYVSLLEKLNRKEFFSKEIYTYLDPILEQSMYNPKNQEWLYHGGQKGGSTALVLTLAMYVQDKEGNQTEIAFFSNDLNRFEHMLPTRKINSFQLKILTDPTFRSRIEKEWGL